MALVRAQRNRGNTHNITITDAAGATVTAGANDLIRARIGRAGQAAKLTVSSEAATANGSSFTKGTPNVLRLDASDLSFAAGIYTLFLDLRDNADAAEWKVIDRQVFHLEESETD